MDSLRQNSRISSSYSENTSDFAITRWNATYGFEFLKFLGDIVDNGNASMCVHVLFKTMQSLVGISFPFCEYDKQTWVVVDCCPRDKNVIIGN